MKNLFDRVVVEEITLRVQQLTPDNTRRWGTMPLAPTLAHCTAGLAMATGAIQPRRAPFPATMVGKLIKPLVFRDDQPMRRNSPTARELWPADPAGCDLERERSRLIAGMHDFASQGPPCCTAYPHPFFGPLTPEQWAILMYKHVDHHLRQFGA